MISANLEQRLFDALPTLNDVPTGASLGKRLGIARKTAQRMIDANDALQKAMEARGREYLESLALPGLLKKHRQTGWMGNLPAYAQKVVQERIDTFILSGIDAHDEVPTVRGLSKKLGIGKQAIRRSIDANDVLQKAMEARGKEHLGKIPLKTLLKKFSRMGWVSGLPEYGKRIVKGRVDSFILSGIKDYDDVPTANGLSRKLGINDITIQRRIDANGALQKAMEARGKEYLESLAIKVLLKKHANNGWMRGLPAYARKIVYERVDRFILPGIQGSDEVPTAKGLSGKLRISLAVIQNRIDANPELWLAYYGKRGLTPDKAIELAIERDEANDATRKVLQNRLRNLHAFREMVGLLRCFDDIFKGAVLHVSLYRNALAEAAAELGIRLDTHFCPMQRFRKKQRGTIRKSDAVVLQGIHRLATESLTSLFNEVYSAIPMGAAILATYSVRHAQTDGFAEALAKNGFEIQDAGAVRMLSPSDETMRAQGVRKEDLERLRRKIETRSQVLVLRKTAWTEAVGIPGLEKAAGGNGERDSCGDAEAIDTPGGIMKDLIATFVPEAKVLPSAPFIVEFVDGSKPRVLIGYGMNPARTNALEVDFYPGVHSADYRRLARKLAGSAAERQKRGIKPNAITRLPVIS